MTTTSIEWTDAVWNPTTGCDRISPGCDHCYALTMAKRLKLMGQPKYQNDGDPRTSGPGFALTTHADALDLPLRWKKPRKIFVNSMSDLFHKDVPWHFIASVFDVMKRCPQHTFQVLTKRPQRLHEELGWEVERARMYGNSNACSVMLDANTDDERIEPLPNVWLGTSVESDRYTFRADHLRATPAAVRWLSLEPLLGPLPSLDLTGIDWVVVGGESGPGARPMHPDWVRDIRDRCVAAGVPFHFKQWGAWAPIVPVDHWPSDRIVDIDGSFEPIEDIERFDLAKRRRSFAMRCVGKHAAGRELDGRTWDEWPR